MAKKNIYRRGAKKTQVKKFERRYGRKKGRRVYGAVVGKLMRRAVRPSSTGGRKARRSQGTSIVVATSS